MEILNPSTVVVMSILDTSISIRGRNLSKGKKRKKNQVSSCAALKQSAFERRKRRRSYFQYMNTIIQEMKKS